MDRFWNKRREIMNSDLTFKYTLQPEDKLQRFNYIPKLIWITGLSASGKSSLANQVDIVLNERGFYTTILDGDKLRIGLNSDLGFSEVDRRENLRRVAEVAKMFLDVGFIVIGAFISPKESDRELVRSIVGTLHFVEVFLDVPIEVCENRDPKGLYAKARQGIIKNFTGIDQHYEKPFNPALVFKNDFEIKDAVESILNYLELFDINYHQHQKIL
jgi:adenylyl-sulfate kinase